MGFPPKHGHCKEYRLSPCVPYAKDKLEIPNMNQLVTLCENRINKPNPLVGVDNGIVETMIV